MSASSQDNYGLLLSYLELISDYSDERHQENDYFKRRYDQLWAYGDCYTSDKLTHQHCLLVKNVQSGILELHCSRHYHKEVYFIRLSLRTLLRELRNPSVVKSHYLFLSVAADLSYKLVESTKATCCECFSTNRADSVYLLFAEINIHCQDFKKEVKIILISPSYEISKSSLYDEHDVYFKPPDNVSLEEEPLTTRIHSLLSLSSLRRLHYFPNNLEQLRSIRSLFQHVRCLTTEMNSYLIDKDSDKFQLSDSIIVHAGFLRNSDLDDFSFIGNEMSQLVMLGIQKTMLLDYPNGIKYLRNLEVLDANDTLITKELPNYVKNLKRLSIIGVGKSSRIITLPGSRMCFKKINMNETDSVLETALGLKVSGKSHSFLSAKVQMPNIIRNVSVSSLKILRFPECNIMKFPDEILKMDLLEELDISNNKIKSIPLSLFTLKNLKKVNVRSNVAKFYGNANVKISANLTHLIMSGNNLPSFFASVKDLSHVKNLAISNWHLHQYSDVFVNSKQLEVFSASLCGLKVLPDSTFDLLGQLKYMDLSGNRFEKLPFSIGRLNNLCVLTLQMNSLKYLPDSFCNLSSLTCLKIGSSQLEELPEDFFNLRKLKVLDLSSNKLKSFPRITMLQDSLNYLDLSNNGLTEFPDLQNAPNLENVELYDNKIKRVPAYIVKRSVLHKLNVSYNQVEELPFEEVRDDLIIHVGNNNFVIPPNEIVDLGMEKIKSYYKDLRRKKVDIIPEVKLILLGNTSAGKTTIGRNLSKHDHPPKPSDRTRVLEASTFDINREDKNFKFTVFDLAGHDVYDSTHRLFFSSNSIYILVVDMSLYNYQEFYPLVGKWYDMLTCYSPKCNVILVGTHEDVLKREQAEKILKEMRRELGKHVEKYCNHHPKRENVVLPDIVAELSINCRNKSHPSYGEIMNLLFKLCKLKKNVSLVSSVPYSWQQFEDALKTYKNKYYLSLDDLQLRIEELKITDVYTVLEYFNLTGKVLYFKSGKLGSYVFHQPLLIADALRSVFMHDNDQLLLKSSRSLLKFWLPKEEPIEVGEKIMNAAKLEGVTGVVLEAMGKDIDNGIFTKKCLEILFHARLGHDVDAELLVDLVKKFEYCYEINKLEAEGHNFYDYQPNEKTFCFPCYLKPSKSTKKLEEFFTTKFSDKSVSTQIIVDVGIRCIEVVTRLVVIIHNYASLAKLVWKYGMIAVIGQVKVLIQHTLLETGGFRITASAQSEEKYKKQIHEKLWRIHECIIKLLTTLPGLQYQAFITCPVCIKSKSKKIHYFPLLHARKDFSETAEKLCPVCESYILVNELMMASASMYGYAQVENVAQFLKNDKFVQGEFTLIATLLEMDHRVKDIRYESSISNSPGPSYWIYLLVKYYVSEKGEDGYIEKLINSLQFLDLNDSAERLRDKVEDLRRLN
ncbi:Uncharacterised protein g2173 [Pycnogonum litorale]